jgi:uncharacterized membrane-anchored protein
MKRVAIAVVALLQVAVLAYMAGEREWTVRHGTSVLLRTGPIDPRDPMRGDYVALSYDISEVPAAACTDGLADALLRTNTVPRGTTVYAVLNTNDTPAQLQALTDRRPAGGVFLRGHVSRHYPPFAPNVRYGIEAYFMQQYMARTLEVARVREGIQVPLDMVLAVSPRGTAVIKGHRWAPLGIGLEVIADPARTNVATARRMALALIRIMNAGTADVALVDLPGGRSFTLQPVSRWSANPWRWADADAPAPAPQPADVVLLKPGQVHTNKMLFRDPHWFVVNTATNRRDALAKPLNHDDLRWDAMFRFEYCAPAPAACAALPQHDLIWHGRLVTRAFGGTDRID